MNIAWQMFCDVEADPTLAVVKTGAEAMRRFQPDVVIALGGGSPMDAAKKMKVMYEDPDVSFEGMAHKLGAAFHIPHGIANALLINHVIRFNAVENPAKIAAFSQYGQPEAIQRYAQVADYLGLKGKTDLDKVEALCDKIDALAKELNIPATIADAGVREADFLAEVDNLAELAFDDQCTGANPRYPLIKELRQMYLNAFYGQSNK